MCVTNEIISEYEEILSQKASPEFAELIITIILTGKNIVHYRLTSANQQAVEAKLKVRSYPSYFIIDREGKIVNDSPSPVFIPATIP